MKLKLLFLLLLTPLFGQNRWWEGYNPKLPVLDAGENSDSCLFRTNLGTVETPKYEFICRINKTQLVLVRVRGVFAAKPTLR